MPTVSSVGNLSGGGGGLGKGPINLYFISVPGPAMVRQTYGNFVSYTFNASTTVYTYGGRSATLDVMLVQGGNPGANFNGATGGVGGAGGTRTITTISVGPNASFPVVVGGAATHSTVGGPTTPFGSRTSSGGTAGGAGGAGGGFPNNPGSPGAAGPTNDFRTGSPVNYAGGGGGGGGWPAPGGAGGAGGGGPGNGGSGVANTGGGGGGGISGYPTGFKQPFVPGGNGGPGGSGIIVIRGPRDFFD